MLTDIALGRIIARDSARTREPPLLPSAMKAKTKIDMGMKRRRRWREKRQRKSGYFRYGDTKRCVTANVGCARVLNRKAASSRSHDGTDLRTVSRSVQMWTGCSCKGKENAKKSIKISSSSAITNWTSSRDVCAYHTLEAFSCVTRYQRAARVETKAVSWIWTMRRSTG